MSTNRYRYLHYDVFTSEPFAGNQLAVLPSAVDLSESRMLTIAREIGFSETAFVLPSEIAGANARLRIFTPVVELPMAGHPTIGSTFALAGEGIIRPGDASFTWQLGTGPAPVDLEWDGEVLHRAWMSQPLPRFGETIDDAVAVTAAIGLGPGDLDPRAPVQVVSSGVPFVFIPLRTRAAVDQASPDVELMMRLAREEDIEHYFVFSVEPGDPPATAYSRMFAPLLGITEDPGTGGASGPLGAYLLHHGLVEPDGARSMVSQQGVAMGRPSRIAIDVERRGEQIERVRVGGQAVLIVEGTIRV